jgi:hypothetical protein
VNIIFALIQIYVIYKRLTNALIFNSVVYMVTIITESMLIVFFIFSALRDFVAADRNYVFDIILIICAAMLALTASFI